MSDELKRFYREIWAWIQDGCPDHPDLDKHHGLCENLMVWSSSNLELRFEQGVLLTKVGYSFTPFNKPSTEYCKERENGTIYRNPKRLAFIEEHTK